MLRVVELQAGFFPPKKMFIGSATGLSLVLVSIRLNTLLGLSMTTPCYNVYPSLELLSLLHIKRNITIFTPGQKPYIWKNKYFPSVIGSDGRAACDWLWANSSYASEGVCVGPDLLNTSYKLQHIYGISVGWNLVKNKRPDSDFFAFSLSFTHQRAHCTIGLRALRFFLHVRLRKSPARRPVTWTNYRWADSSAAMLCWWGAWELSSKSEEREEKLEERGRNINGGIAVWKSEGERDVWVSHSLRAQNCIDWTWASCQSSFVRCLSMACSTAS